MIFILLSEEALWTRIKIDLDSLQLRTMNNFNQKRESKNTVEQLWRINWILYCTFLLLLVVHAVEKMVKTENRDVAIKYIYVVISQYINPTLRVPANLHAVDMMNYWVKIQHSKRPRIPVFQSLTLHWFCAWLDWKIVQSKWFLINFRDMMLTLSKPSRWKTRRLQRRQLKRLPQKWLPHLGWVGR